MNRLVATFLDVRSTLDLVSHIGVKPSGHVGPFIRSLTSRRFVDPSSSRSSYGTPIVDGLAESSPETVGGAG